MTERFYTTQPLNPSTSEQGASGSVELTGTEAHHLRNVLRRTVGEHVVLFDGLGTEAEAEIESFSKRTAGLRILTTRTDPPSETSPLVLATAVPKGERFRWLVEKATELGVARLTPLVTARSVVDPRVHKLEKMRQTVIAACKQSGRNRLMEIDEPIAWTEFVERDLPNHRAFVADPSGTPVIEQAVRVADTAAPIIAAVGPEGGFTAAEIDQSRAAGATLVSLGRSILRIETAAIALAACIGACRPGIAFRDSAAQTEG